MKQRRMITVGLLFLMLEIAGCASIGGSSEPILEVVGLDRSVSLSMDDLQDMPVAEGWSGTVSSSGKISPPMQIKGVSLVDLADLVGGLEGDVGIKIVAKDGYSITMSYDQIISGNFITYDPGTGDEKEIDDPLIAVVGYERGGESIPEDDDGPLRIFILSDRNNQIVDGHWTVKWVEKLELKPLAEDWVLYLEGTITEDLDRASFETCMAPGCHGSSWVDEEGNEWSGVPLYLLAGRVDDANVHEDRAYNDDYAVAGYDLEIFTADGYNATIPSSQSNFNEDLIIAMLMNNEFLVEDQFPLRLVGDDLEEIQMVSQIAQIVIVPNIGVEVPSAETIASEPGVEPTVDLTLPEGAVLKIAGNLRNQLMLTLENIEALGVVEVEVEHPKKGALTYQGVKLGLLLSLAGVEEDAKMLVITSADRYSAEIPLTQVEACENCLVALGEDGSLIMAMDGLDSSFWVKDVIHLMVR
jgi:DMSO/TMAO reductase YedYZ molybdopterin-dependent catalytic subunit